MNTKNGTWYPVTIRMTNRLRRFGLRSDDRRRTMTLSVSFVFEGAGLEVERLRTALSCLSDAHPALRTKFRVTEGSEPEQCVLPPGAVDVPLEVVHCRPLDGPDLTEEARGHLQRETETAFDLGSGTLLRAQLLTDSEGSHVITLSTDHIVSDGMSVEVMMADLVAAYENPESFREKASDSRMETLVEFADYQRALVDGPRGKELLEEWRDRLPNGIPNMVVPRDFDVAEVTNNGDHLTALISRSGYRNLRGRMRDTKASPFVLAAAGLLMEFRRRGATGDLSFMTPCAGRPVEGFEETVGNFTNVLPVLVNAPQSADLTAMVRCVRSGAAWLMDHQEMPFASVVEAVDPASTSFFPHERPQIFLSYQTRQSPRLGPMTGSEVKPDHIDALFDMSLWLTDLGDRMLIDLVYRRELFAVSTAEAALAAVVDALTDGR